MSIFGAIGPTGPTGYTGPMGPDGLQGDQGPAGDASAMYPIGVLFESVIEQNPAESLGFGEWVLAYYGEYEEGGQTFYLYVRVG